MTKLMIYQLKHIDGNEAMKQHDIWGLYYEAGFGLREVTSGLTLDVSGSLLTGLNHLLLKLMLYG